MLKLVPNSNKIWFTLYHVNHIITLWQQDWNIAQWTKHPLVQQAHSKFKVEIIFSWLSRRFNPRTFSFALYWTENVTPCVTSQGTITWFHEAELVPISYVGCSLCFSTVFGDTAFCTPHLVSYYFSDWYNASHGIFKNVINVPPKGLVSTQSESNMSALRALHYH